MPRRFKTPRRHEARYPAAKGWEQYALGGHSLGPADAPVTIVVFSDFQCPFCRDLAMFHDSLSRLGYGVNVIHRHFPLPIHEFAEEAARASECAADQGRFSEMYAALFAQQHSIGSVPWAIVAELAAIQDPEAARAAGVTGAAVLWSKKPEEVERFRADSLALGARLLPDPVRVLELLEG